MNKISALFCRRSFMRYLLTSLTFAFLTLCIFNARSWATEHGASVYPVGVETVMPGMTPPGKGTMLFEFTTFYEANEMVNSQGQNAAGEFKLRVLANAVKLVHNWNVPVLGGRFNTNIAIPQLYEELHVAPGSYSKQGLGNIDIGVFQVGYAKGALHGYYEGDVFLPGGSYTNSDILNVGQHNFATAPVAGLTYLPFHEKLELSSKALYIVNFHDTATHYNGGNELTWEYDAMGEVSKRVALGVNGYLYQQTTDDHQNGAIVGDGNRGRDLTVGPEVRMHVGRHVGMAVKYLRDTLVENKPSGNAFWFQMGIPLSFGHAGK